MRALPSLLGTLAAVLCVAVTSASGIDRPQTFSVLEIDESGPSTVIGGFEFQRPPVAGDRFAFKSSLYKWAGSKRGARIGHDEGLCTFTDISGGEQSFSADAQCSASFFLPAGTIVATAVVHLTNGPAKFEIPVVGGTGAYANARGFIRLRDLGNGDLGRTSLTFHLLP